MLEVLCGLSSEQKGPWKRKPHYVRSSYVDEWRGTRRSPLAAGLPLTHSSEKENLSLLILQKTITFRVKGIIAWPIAVYFNNTQHNIQLWKSLRCCVSAFCVPKQYLSVFESLCEHKMSVDISKYDFSYFPYLRDFQIMMNEPGKPAASQEALCCVAPRLCFVLYHYLRTFPIQIWNYTGLQKSYLN